MNNHTLSILSKTSKRLSVPLAVLWGISSAILIIGLLTDNFPVQIVGAILAAAYVLILILWLGQSKPYATELPNLRPAIQPFRNYKITLAFTLTVTIALVALTSLLFKDGWLMLLFSIPFSLVIIILGRKRLQRRYAIASVVTMVVLAIAEQMLGSEMSSGLVMPMGAALMFLAGVLLLDYTQLTQIRLVDGEYRKAAQSFLWGCVLAIPPALLNLVTTGLVSPSDFDLLFDRWWEPLYALQPGILEEIWARLFLTTLVYALLRPTSNERPQRAVVWAIIIAAFLHGMAHFPGSITNPLEGVLITLIYGIPLALLFIKRDLEQAIAYHFFIDLIRFGAFVIWNNSV